MHPVAGVVHADGAGVLEVVEAAVLLRVGGPRFGAVDEQRRAGDAPVEAVGLARRHAHRRPGAGVVVELPAVGAVFVLVAAVDGQMPRLFGGEMRIGLLHALEGVLQRRVALRNPRRELAQIAHPVEQPLVAGRGVVAGARRHAHAFDGHQLAHALRIQPGVGQRHRTAHRMADQRDVLDAGLPHQLGDVVDVVDGGVAAAHQPLRIAVAAQIGRDDVVVVLELLRHPVPVAAMVAPAMHKQHGRRPFVAPIHVVQPQPLREVDVGGRPSLQFGASVQARASSDLMRSSSSPR